MLEVELSGKTYRIGKLTAFQQFHVGRKVSPIIPLLVPIYTQVRKGKGSILDDLDTLAALLGPFTQGIADLSDETSEYVIGTCLSVVQRKQDHGFAAVWNVSHKVCMFDDIDIGVMLPLVVQVITENLGSFIQGLLTSQASSPPAEQSSGEPSQAAKTG